MKKLGGITSVRVLTKEEIEISINDSDWYPMPPEFELNVDSEFMDKVLKATFKITPEPYEPGGKKKNI